MWYQYDENDRIKNVYSKHTIKDFWDWWSDGQDRVMEVRIKSFDMIREVAKVQGLPYSASGVFVRTAEQLKTVIAMVRNKTTVWFGIQPRKKNWNKWGDKSYGGSDTNVDSVNFIFVDIDRIKKETFATNDDLLQCNQLADMILERLGKQGWNNSYIKLCSGNGVQLLIKLDFSIKIPNVDYDGSKKIFIPNEEYNTIKHLVYKGIGDRITRFGKQFKELGVEVDKSGFRLSQVGALPCTKNYKYGSFRWRGIIDIKNKNNVGLTDYVLSKKEDVKLYNKKNVFKTKIPLDAGNILKGNSLHNNKLITFMLENDFPEGYINNTLWMQLKCLLRDNKVDLNSKEFLEIHNELKRKHRRTFTLNMPDKNFTFDANIVNRYCIDHQMPPVYKLWPARTKTFDSKFDVSCVEDFLTKEIIKLEEDTTILDDLEVCKKKLKRGDWNNRNIIGAFINGCLKKYGRKKTTYYFEYLFDRYFNYE